MKWVHVFIIKVHFDIFPKSLNITHSQMLKIGLFVSGGQEGNARLSDGGTFLLISLSVLIFQMLLYFYDEILQIERISVGTCLSHSENFLVFS